MKALLFIFATTIVAFAQSDMLVEEALNFEIESEQKNIISWGISLGTRFSVGEVAEFNNELFNVGQVVFDQDADDGLASPTIQFTFKYGVDNIWPGITFGVKLDYSHLVVDTELEVIVDGVQAFFFDDDLLSVHSLGLVPNIEFRIFSLLESFFPWDLPEYYEIYFNIGARINYNIPVEEDGDLDIENFENFNLGFEVGIGTEFFVADNVSWRFDLAWYTNKSDFDVEQAGVQVFSSELDADAVKLTFGFIYYL